MIIKEETNTFNNMQNEFINQMTYGIKNILANKGISEDKLYDITDDLVFNICTLLDGCVECGEDDNPFVPYLAFNQPDSNPEILLVSEYGSSLHDNAISIIKKVFI